MTTPSARVYPSFLLFVALKNQTSIVATETHRVGHSDVDRALTRLIWYIVQIAVGIRVVQVNGGRNDACLNSHDGNDRFHTTSRSQGVEAVISIMAIQTGIIP